MAFSPDDDSVLSSDGAGALTVASLTASTGDITATAGSVSCNGITGGVRTNTADAACALVSTDSIVLLSTTGAGTNAITNSSLADGQVVTICLTAISTGTYEMASVIGSGGSGTLTFNAANETATIYFDGTNVRVLSLNGATVV